MRDMRDALSEWALAPGRDVAATVQDRGGLDAARTAIMRGRRRRNLTSAASSVAAIAAVAIVATSVLPGLGGNQGIGPAVSTDVHQGDVPLIADAGIGEPDQLPFVCGEEYIPWAEPGVTYSGLDPETDVEFEGTFGLLTDAEAVGGGEFLALQPEGSLTVDPTGNVRAWIEVIYGEDMRDAQGRPLYEITVHAALVQDGVVVNVPPMSNYVKNGYLQERNNIAVEMGFNVFPTHALEDGSTVTGASVPLGQWTQCPAPPCPAGAFCLDPWLVPGEYSVHTVVQVFDPLTKEVMVTAVDAVDLGANVLVVADAGEEATLEPLRNLTPPTNGVYTGYVANTPEPGCWPHADMLRDGAPGTGAYQYELTSLRATEPSFGWYTGEPVATTTVASTEDTPWYVHHPAWLVIESTQGVAPVAYLDWTGSASGDGPTEWRLTVTDDVDPMQAVNVNCVYDLGSMRLNGDMFLVLPGFGEEEAPLFDVASPIGLQTWVYLGGVALIAD